MTRLLCLADVHLGAGAAMLAPGERLSDQERVLSLIADLAWDREVDAILVAGDVFHRPRPTPEELHAWRRFLGRLTCPVLAIVGNAGHDIESDGRPSALELFAGGQVVVHRQPGLWGCKGVQVGTLPSTPIGRLVAALPDTGRDELYQVAAELLVGQAAELRAQGASILVAHWSVSGAVTPTGMPVGPDFGVVLPLAELEAQGWDAIVLGHIHKQQRLDAGVVYSTRPGDMGADYQTAPIFYCSSPMPQDFGEANDPHGVVILDDSSGMMHAEFVAIPSRPLVTVEAGADELSESIANACVVIAAELPGAIVRLRYTASEEQHRRIDQHAIRAALMQAGAAAVRVEPTILRATRARGEGIAEAATLLDQVDLYLAANELPDDRGERVRDLIETMTQEAAPCVR